MFETFEEEIVLVNLDSGNYYSLSGTAPSIWLDLAAGLSLEEIGRRIQACHSGEPEVIAAAVRAFVDRLVDAEVLIGAANDAMLRREVSPVEPPGERTPFETPVLESYADMQDLLSLDPIHEVDTAGWPVAEPRPE